MPVKKEYGYQAGCVTKEELFADSNNQITTLTTKLDRYKRALELATEEEARLLDMNCPLPEDECIHCHDYENSCHTVVQLNYLDDADKPATQADNNKGGE
jgi:hypothetical protein